MNHFLLAGHRKSHRISVLWYICLRLVDLNGKFVRKYTILTIRESYGNEQILSVSLLFTSIFKIRSGAWKEFNWRCATGLTLQAAKGISFKGVHALGGSDGHPHFLTERWMIVPVLMPANSVHKFPPGSKVGTCANGAAVQAVAGLRSSQALRSHQGRKKGIENCTPVNIAGWKPSFF